MMKTRTNRPDRLNNLNITGIVTLYPPRVLTKEVAITRRAAANVYLARQTVKRILAQQDERLLVLTGPCSVHNPDEALEYARWLAEMRRRYGHLFHIVMRVYLAKPRTTIGWKGYAYDPHLDGSGRIDIGLRESRRLLLAINELGVPCGTEFVDPFMPQYVADQITLACIGARTTESQLHREVASGLSMPVGFKNTTEGSVKAAADGIETARHPHCFLGLDEDGRIAMVKSRGNPDCYLILRGSNTDPNYDAASVEAALNLLGAAGLNQVLMVDCSHGNSRKKQVLQPEAWQDVIDQRASGTNEIIGLMLESSLQAGSQKVSSSPHHLKHGVSITDECVDILTTERLFAYAERRFREAGRVLVSVGTRRPAQARQSVHLVRPKKTAAL